MTPLYLRYMCVFPKRIPHQKILMHATWPTNCNRFNFSVITVMIYLQVWIIVRFFMWIITCHVTKTCGKLDRYKARRHLNLCTEDGWPALRFGRFIPLYLILVFRTHVDFGEEKVFASICNRAPILKRSPLGEVTGLSRVSPASIPFPHSCSFVICPQNVHDKNDHNDSWLKYSD